MTTYKTFPTDITLKSNPTDSDVLLIADSADSNELKKITIGSITADIGDGLIVDGSESTTTTYSSTKINDLNEVQDTTINTKLTRAGQLRTGNGAWKVSHTNGSGDEVELALGTAGQVLTSSGAASAPTFTTPTADVNALTEDTTGSMANDFLLAYDASAAANRKQKPQVYSATLAEDAAKASSTKWVTPAGLAVLAPMLTKFQGYAAASLPTSFSIAHGLGYAPTYVKVRTLVGKGWGSGYIQYLVGEGAYKSGSYSTWYVNGGPSNPPALDGTFLTTTSTISQFYWESTANSDDMTFTMTISSIDATNINFAITRTIGGSASGNILFAIEAMV